MSYHVFAITLELLETVGEAITQIDQCMSKGSHDQALALLHDCVAAIGTIEINFFPGLTDEQVEGITTRGAVLKQSINVALDYYERQQSSQLTTVFVRDIKPAYDQWRQYIESIAYPRVLS